MPKISIIVPVYNVEKYLPRCLDSIIGQTFKDWECLVIDDGSTDTSGTICDEYARKDNRVKVFHKKNGGLTSARNHGLERAHGDWIMHVDGDDWIELDSIEQMLSTAESSDADVVIGDFKFRDGKKESIYVFSDWTNDKILSLSNYISSVWTILCAGIAKNKLYINNSLKSPLEITYCEDFYLMARLCWFANKVKNCHYPFYNYRQHSSSIMHNLSRKTESDEQWAYIDTIRFFKEQGVYGQLSKALSWRLLKATQEMLLRPEEHKKFLEICSDVSNRDVLTCPFINSKLKVMAVMLKNKLRFVVVALNKIRNLLYRT